MNEFQGYLGKIIPGRVRARTKQGVWEEGGCAEGSA